ncbi:MAG: chemotaxis protein CheA, partial [Longimicrobiales bacterium]
RALRESAPVLGSDPADPENASAGTLTVFFGPGAEPDSIDPIVRGVGEVVDVAFTRPGTGVGTSPDPLEADGPGSANLYQRRYLRVDVQRLDQLADGMAELGVLQARLRELAVARGGEQLLDAVDRAGRRVGELQDTVMSVRMVPLREAFDRFPRIVRDTARAVGKRVELDIEGAGTEVDRAIVDAIADPLVHLLRNAVDHGIEPPAMRKAAGKPEVGRLTLRAEREQSRVAIQISDDGAGIDRAVVVERARTLGLADAGAEEVRDAELLRILGQSGFSMASAVTELSGRGVGLDVVLDRVRALGGSIEMRTESGTGTTFTIRLPLTLSVGQALRVRIGYEDYMIPLTHVVEAVELDPASVTRIGGEEALHLRGELVPMTRLSRLLGTAAPVDAGAAVIAESGERRGALAVDVLIGREQIVLKAFDAAVGTLPIFTGVTLLADGRPALVLDPLSIF